MTEERSKTKEEVILGTHTELERGAYSGVKEITSGDGVTRTVLEIAGIDAETVKESNSSANLVHICNTKELLKKGKTLNPFISMN